MMHQILDALGPLSQAFDDDLERAVDLLMAEAHFDPQGQAERAEALAILSHEMRRRLERQFGGVMAQDNPLVRVVDPVATK